MPKAPAVNFSPKGHVLVQRLALSGKLQKTNAFSEAISGNFSLSSLPALNGDRLHTTYQSWEGDKPQRPPQAEKLPPAEEAKQENRTGVNGEVEKPARRLLPTRVVGMAHGHHCEALLTQLGTEAG